MPRTKEADDLHADKYRSPGETFKEAMTRVAGAVSDGEDHFQRFRDILLNQAFLPGGRNQAALGSTRGVTPYNCFVSGTIEDSFVAGTGSIMDRAKEAASTMRMGGGIGYDFSTLRPRNALIKKLGSLSSGPISFMGVYDAVCESTRSAGERRGAQMGVLRIDHPDIEEFIHAKRNENQLTNFNVSVGVTDRFMECLRDGTPFPLEFNGEVYKEVDPRALWDNLMRSTWDWAEPGVLFIDTINRMNNLRYCETIAATNPCGEQPLPPFGACLLGSFNLVQYLSEAPDGYVFNLDFFRDDIAPVVRAMDNVVDAAVYPLYEQEKEAKAKRRMGLGITGLANALEACGAPYGSDQFIEFQERILSTLRDEAYRASVELAKEKGSFPALDRDRYLMTPFIRNLPEDIRQGIADHGIRNSHLLSIAPTGTISFTADNVSSGIEPVVGMRMRRKIRTRTGPRVVELADYGHRFLGVQGRTVNEVDIDDHLRVLALATRYVDSAVSKTCTIPAGYSWEDFKQVYERAWEMGCKGITTYRVDGKREGILESIDEETGACYVDPETGRRDCDA